MNFHGGQFKQKGLYDFSVNIPNTPYDQDYMECLKQNIENLMEYPEIDGISGRLAISKVVKCSPDDIVLGNGATDLIYLSTRALKLKNVMIVNPTFTEYARALLQSGSQVTNYLLTERQCNQTMGYGLEISDLVKTIVDNGCDGLFMCNPNNPTGTFFDALFFQTLYKTLEDNANIDLDKFVLIIDESFIEFKSRETYHQNMRRLMERQNILFIRSMTKTYSVPGLRLGYAFGNPKVIERVAHMREPWALNRFALDSIPYFLSKKNYLNTLQSRTHLLRSKLHAQLLAFEKISIADSETNYLLIKVDVQAPQHWHNRLIEKGFYLRTCLDFVGLGPQYFRIAIKDVETNQKLINAIGEIEHETQL